ncbi:MAG: serine/threonine protein kinase [Lyngbya sp. HA4199-MV5]|jgi:serine/threonine protein kinase|nr:serine/threonine protein kinase [Lyngbya sp. HA4199-MV5]
MYRDFSIRAPSCVSAAGDALGLDDPCISPFNQPHLLLQQRYRLLKLLGEGGFGKTFLARDEQQPEPSFCVVKQLLFNSTHPQIVELFQQEVQRLAEVGDHPQIPRLLHNFEQDGQLFIVQEWIDGSTLEQEALEHPFDEKEIWALLRDLLPILQYLHDRHIIHRDIKPANIIRRHTGEVCRHANPFVLVDFGAAKQIGAVYATGTLIGSAEYAAPEQIRGKAMFVSDLYSLGVTCLHLLTQMSPFDLYDVGEATWKWEAYLTQPISASLQHILCTLVEPTIRRRYQSAIDVLAALEALDVQADQPITPVDQSIAASAPGLTNGLANPCANGTTPLEVLPTAIASIHTLQTVQSITTATLYNPQTQRWYSFPSKTKSDRHPVPPQSLMSWRLVTVGLGTAVASVAVTCLWLCVSIIFLALAVPPQSSAIPAKATSSALPR